MKRIWLFGLLVAGVLVLGCSSSDSESCTDSTECSLAHICVDGTCSQIECMGHADCTVGLGTPFCADYGIDPNQPEMKFCSPVWCQNDADCLTLGAGLVCDLVTKECISGGSSADVITDLDITGGDVKDVGEEDIQGTDGGNVCQACSTDGDCSDGTKCLPLGGGTFCFEACATNNDCATGWLCYALSTDGKQCVPNSFQCSATCLLDGCAAGLVCNQDSGACETGAVECGACQYDWDCAEGFRCYESGDYCAPLCGTGCPESSTCLEVNSQVVSLCVSDAPTCCYGSDCGEQCTGDKPYAKNGICVECLTNDHCDAGETCNTTGSCTSATCQDPNLPYEKDGACVQCLLDSHCTSFGTDYTCKNNVCTPSTVAPECQYCADPYPACIQLNGVWSCVQCTADEHCGAGTCDLSLYSCDNGGLPNSCVSNPCSSNADCVSSTGTFALACDIPSGCCYDTGGWCDNVEAMCPGGGNCAGMMDLLMGGMMEGMGDMIPMEGSYGACECEQPYELMGLIGCVMGACPTSPDCQAGTVCVSIDIMSMLTGGSTPSTASGYCINPSALLGLLGM